MLVSFYTFYVTNITISRISGNSIKSNNLGARVRGCLLTVKGYYFWFGPWIWGFPVNRTFLVLINYIMNSYWYILLTFKITEFLFTCIDLIYIYLICLMLETSVLKEINIIIQLLYSLIHTHNELNKNKNSAMGIMLNTV